MGKTYRDRRRFDEYDESPRSPSSPVGGSGSTEVWVDTSEIHMDEGVVQALLSRDGAQINQMRADYEAGRRMVPVWLFPSPAGGYDMDEGRHRVIACRLAGVPVNAIIFS